MALRDESRRQMEADLPADARRAERQRRREAAHVAREQALGLTDVQRDRLQTRRLDRVRQSPEPLDLRPFLDVDGRLDRVAYRQAQQARRKQARAAAQARRQQGEDVLTQEQRDVVLIHRALVCGRRGKRQR